MQQRGLLTQLVGDAVQRLLGPGGDAEDAVLGAVREALVNVAKHAGVDTADVFVENDGRTLSAFVRDRGRGFDLDTVGEDRMGVKGSIIDRMRRHGGSATIRTGPDIGTEVRLEVTR